MAATLKTLKTATGAVDTSQFMPLHPTYRTPVLMLSHLCLGLPSGLPSDFPTKTLYRPHLYPIPTTCPAHLNFLHLITRMVIGMDYSTQCFLLCSLLHSIVCDFLHPSDIMLYSEFSRLNDM